MESGRTKILLWALTAAILGGSLWALYATGFFQAAGSPEAMGEYIARCAPWSHLAYFGIQLASVIVAPIPSNITAAAGAWLFGLWPAFLLTWGAVVLGSALVFTLARVLGQEFAGQFVGEKLSDKYLDLLRRKRDVFLALAFLFPFFPDDLLCILAGLTDISFKRFLLLVVAARPWGLLVACMVGSATVAIPWWGMGLLGIGGLALFLLALKYGDRLEDALIDRLDTDALLSDCKRRYSGVARLGIEALELKIRGYSGADIARLYNTKPSHVGAWIARAAQKIRKETGMAVEKSLPDS